MGLADCSRRFAPSWVVAFISHVLTLCFCTRYSLFSQSFPVHQNEVRQKKKIFCSYFFVIVLSTHLPLLLLFSIHRPSNLHMFLYLKQKRSIIKFSYTTLIFLSLFFPLCICMDFLPLAGKWNLMKPLLSDLTPSKPLQAK